MPYQVFYSSQSCTCRSLTTDALWLDCEVEIWAVVCNFKVWHIFIIVVFWINFIQFQNQHCIICIISYTHTGPAVEALTHLPPGGNDRHFTDNIFRCILVNEKFCILIKISLKFVPKGPIDNNPALIQIMAWHRIGDKPLSEPMLTQFADAYIQH